MRNILVIDDDIHIGNMLEETLTREGYGVLRAYSGTEALLLLEKVKPDLVLLDLMLPGLQGEEVLSRIKGIPVIVVSAKAETDNKVTLLLGGAVDYVTKPFEVKELLARIAVQFRKAAAGTARQKLNFDEITLDTDTHLVTVKDTVVKLTRTEYGILKLLMENAGQVMTKSLLLDRVSEETPDCTESSLKMHVSNLRKKLREVNNKDYIDLLSGEENSPDAQRYIQIIRNRADMLKQLTEELFDYSVMVAAHEGMKREPVNVNRILEEGIAAFYTQLCEKKIVPSIFMPEEKVVRWLDKDALARVFANLLNNAVKYSKGDLEIRLRETGEIAFVNTAPDLDEVQVGRLFDRFYTVEAADHSTGLGLSIARMLVERMDGKIDAGYEGGKLKIEIVL